MDGNNYFSQNKSVVIKKKLDKVGKILFIIGIIIFGYKFYGRLIPINAEIYDSIEYHSSNFDEMYESNNKIIIVCGNHIDMIDKQTNVKLYDVPSESLYDTEEYSTITSGLYSAGYEIKAHIFYTLLNPAIFIGLAFIFFGLYRNFNDPKKHRSYEEFTKSSQMYRSDREENYFKNLSTGIGNKKDSNK